MAPLPPTVVEIVPWPHFQGFVDARPAIGGKLYTFAPASSTPKASYVDPFFITPQTNPVILDDQGAATVYLDGFYHLRFTDHAGVLYWDVDNYAFAPGVTPAPGEVQTGSGEASLSAVAGPGPLVVTGLAPAGYRILGVQTHIEADFGTSGGLTALLIGDDVYEDSWGRQPVLTAGAVTTQRDFRRGDGPISATAYSVLIAPEGGLFDPTGQIHVHVFWQSVTGEPHP